MNFFVKRMVAAAQEELTVEFLTDVLRRCEKNESIIINKFETGAACEDGCNFTCDVSRVIAHGTKKNEKGEVVEFKTSLIVKRLPKHPEDVLFYCSYTALQNEANIYEFIIPPLEAHAVGGTVPFAKCLYYNPVLMLLQDLQLQGYRTISISEGGFNLKQCKAVIQALAKLHAASMVLLYNTPRFVEPLNKLVKDLLFQGGSSELRDTQHEFVQAALNMFKNMAVTSENEIIINALERLAMNLETIVENCVMYPDRYQHAVITHGDAWISNIMFNKDDTEVKLVDLQQMRYNSVASDLCFLFYVNMQPSLLDENVESLLDEYLEALKKNVSDKVANLDKDLTMEWLINEMSSYAPYGLVMTLWLSPMFYYKSKESIYKRNDIENVLTNIGAPYLQRVRTVFLNCITKLNPFIGV